ncbi:acyltransferase [Shewanella eurypsychrophilus]|uniref:Acyltransferase n=1 Tax=Shewanella eurypsychrophilus TaxID=2593656 RepID=A0ABX6V9H3_9GAMM|nr:MULTISPECIES: acyltransferase family protein [Shewanella]QFU23434.1 acyltransferase family protein [Shewanella sp. YLB-09]QPG58662.1 acyltransferase [Shewanella eurypsychrophilus]
MSFRHDINFLRCFAVLSVLLFHFEVTAISGGFAGVDIFFVISGFLMTKIIFQGIDHGSFSLIKFYISRAKRIIPALAFLCLCLVIIGWFILLPTEYRQLGKHATSSLVFLSNIIFSAEAGYFDTASHEKLLLHTWSLSIEWQFYILYPLLILLFKKLVGAPQLRVTLLLLTLALFLYNLFVNYVGDGSQYFSLLCRSWEMLLGGVAYLYPLKASKSTRAMLAYIGITGLITSIFLVDSSYQWPGTMTLLPVLATFLVIFADHKDGRIFSLKPFNLLGNISYSVYLWHWPIAVLCVRAFGEISAIHAIFGIVISLLLGYLSFIFIEQSFKNFNNSLKLASYSLVSLVTVLVVTVSIYLVNGAPYESRFAKNIIVADQEFLNREPRKGRCLSEKATSSPRCTYGPEKSLPDLILIGDSHASTMVNAVVKSLPSDSSVLFIAQAGCPTIKGVTLNNSNAESCRSFIDNELANIQQNYPHIPILVVNRWSYYISGKLGEEAGARITLDDPNIGFQKGFNQALEQTWCSIADNSRVIFMTPTPEFPMSMPKNVARMLLDGDFEAPFVSMASYSQRNHVFIEALEQLSTSCNIETVNVTQSLCKNDRCFGTTGERPNYYDDNHLSEWGARLLVPQLTKLLN